MKIKTQTFGIAVLMLNCIVPAQANAQFLQQGEKLVGAGAAGNALQGSSVSLSSDGNTAIVGGYGDSNEVGAAWLFTRIGSTWSQQGNKIIGTGGAVNAHQGASVCLSSDGNTAIVGGPSLNGDSGAAWIFARSGVVWSQQGEKLVGTGAVGNSVYQGISVSLSADGNTAIVGGPLDSNSGAAWVFTRNGSVWSQQGEKLVGTSAVGNARQGRSVSLSADGNTAIMGGPWDGGTGAAWVFVRSNGVWSQQGDKLVGTGSTGGGQGYSVSLSGDGNTAIVGGVFDSDTGAAWVFTRSSGVWSQQGDKLVGTGAVGSAQQGESVSLSADGNTAFVGGYGDSEFGGAAWVFTRSDGVWSQQGEKLVGTGAEGSQSGQGESVSISSDGSTAIVGGYLDNEFRGAAWVFNRSGIVSPVSPGWNLVSIPVTLNDYRKTSVYPSSISSAYTYQSPAGYVWRDTLSNGAGYWVKFGSSDTINTYGLLRDLDTVDVNNGWNIVGSISYPVNPDSIIQIPPGIVASGYYGYNGTYTATDTLVPGKSYWVKVSQNGKLVLR